MYSPLLQAFAFNNSLTGRLLRPGLLFLMVALALPAFSLTARAVTPAPDGGYPNGNTAEGTDALFSLTTGTFNTANGSSALYSNTSGDNNTATGFQALRNNRTGGFNTANGFKALWSLTTGNSNTATGNAALYSNTTGNNNTATGFKALTRNVTGYENTATGFEALFTNTRGYDNTATGFKALFGNTGTFNTATGAYALQNNSGNSNTATGMVALLSNTTGLGNTADGAFALYVNTTGADNTATGNAALASNTTGNYNTAYGAETLSNTIGTNNIALGFFAGYNLTTGDNNIDIGNLGVGAESNTIRIGEPVAVNPGAYLPAHTATFIAGISGATIPNGVAVIVDSSGHLGTIQSSARFKEAIKPMDKASEAILALKPVTFRYKEELDPNGVPQFGLIAEQVEKVNPDLVVRDEDGKVMTVRYEAVNAMLLNEFLKEHKKVEEQGAMIAQQQKQIEALTTTVQKVSAQLEPSRLAPELIANGQ